MNKATFENGQLVVDGSIFGNYKDEKTALKALQTNFGADAKLSKPESKKAVYKEGTLFVDGNVFGTFKSKEIAAKSLEKNFPAGYELTEEKEEIKETVTE